MLNVGAMASLEESMKTMVRIFRRECHRVVESERTTIRGSDEMLMALQLTMAEVNKQVIFPLPTYQPPLCTVD